MHNSGSSEVQAQGTARASVWWELTPGSHMAILALCPHKAQRDWGSSLRTLLLARWSHWWGLCTQDLTTSPRLHLLLMSHWGADFQRRNLGGYKHSIYCSAYLFCNILCFGTLSRSPPVNSLFRGCLAANPGLSKGSVLIIFFLIYLSI